MHWIHNFGSDKSPCRVNHATVSLGNFIYSFGGYCQQSTSLELKLKNPIDVHVLNTINYKWFKRPVPIESDPQYYQTPYFRYGHTCVAHNNLIYLWGGRSDWTNNLCNSLFVYDPNKHNWNIVEINGDKPEGRDGHSACVRNDSMYIFGGFVQKIKRFSNDIHEFNFLTSTWSNIIPKNDIRPYWRDFHTASIIENKMYIFGGRMDVGRTRFTGENFYSNDLYSFNFTTSKWTCLIPDQSSISNQTQSISNLKYSPSGRRSHSAVIYENKILIFGGYQENIQKHYNDLHEYDPNKNEWRLIKPKGICPSQRRRHGCNIVNGQMIIFGGTGPRKIEQQLADTRQLIVEPIIDNIIQNNLDNISYERLLQTFERNLNYVQNAVRERNNLDFVELNNILLASRIRLNNLRNIPIDALPPPQNEYDQILEEQNEDANDDNLENNENDNNNNIVDVIEDDEIDFYDSDSDDLINEETDDEDDLNLGLISLSDLHILELGVPSLKTLSKLAIIENKTTYKCLPKVLIDEIDYLKQ